MVETCIHSLETIINKKKVRWVRKERARMETRHRWRLWKARAPQGLARRKQDLFLSYFHISAVTKDKTTTDSC